MTFNYLIKQKTAGEINIISNGGKSAHDFIFSQEPELDSFQFQLSDIDGYRCIISGTITFPAFL